MRYNMRSSNTCEGWVNNAITYSSYLRTHSLYHSWGWSDGTNWRDREGTSGSRNASSNSSVSSRWSRAPSETTRRCAESFTQFVSNLNDFVYHAFTTQTYCVGRAGERTLYFERRSWRSPYTRYTKRMVPSAICSQKRCKPCSRWIVSVFLRNSYSHWPFHRQPRVLSSSLKNMEWPMSLSLAKGTWTGSCSSVGYRINW